MVLHMYLVTEFKELIYMWEEDGGGVSCITKNELLVAPSGWVEDGKRLFTRGNMSGIVVHDGDLVSEKGNVKLVITKPEKLSAFSVLAPLAEWAGKEIAEVKSVVGSRIIFPPGRSNNELDNIYMVKFIDGMSSEFIAETEVFLGSFHGDDLDINILVDIGMLTAVDIAERDAEIKFFQELREENEELVRRRGELQRSLLAAGWRDGRKIYRELEVIELRITAIEIERESRSVKWHARVFDFTYISNFVPGLADIFDLTNRKHLYGRKVDDMVCPIGKSIAEIIRLFDASECKEDSRDIYTLRFSDGSFSTPFGVCSGLKMELPVESLVDAGLVSRPDVQKAESNLDAAIIQSSKKETDKRRLAELKKELEEFGLGEKRTRRVLQEIAVLEG